MDHAKQRVNYDLIAHLCDEPGRDYGVDPGLTEYLNNKPDYDPYRFRILDMGCGTGKQLTANHNNFADLESIGLDLFHGMLLQAVKCCPAINWIQGESANPPFSQHPGSAICLIFSLWINLHI